MRYITSQVTIVVVPRERFSYTSTALESLYRNTHCPFHLVYIDGYSPPQTHTYLQQQAEEKGFTLVRTEHSLSPNQARNLGLLQVTTPYVVFIDNDVLVNPGWLTSLVKCTEETGAAVVTPLQFEKKRKESVIHIAGGQIYLWMSDGKRRFLEKHRFRGQTLSKVASVLKRETTGLVEFHCVLVRTKIFEQYGILDEQLLSLAEHTDLCLMLQQNGEQIWFEPNSHATYVPPPPYNCSGKLDDLLELSFFLLRWSDQWNQKSLNHFCHKWGIPRHDPFIISLERWLVKHRLQVAGAYLKG